MDIREISIRAVKTFIQAASAVLVVTDVSTVEAAATAGAAAAVAVVWNAVIAWASE
jgi:hypothetical protein